MREPIFRVVLVQPENTNLGYEWIEVLAIYPFRFGETELSEDFENRDQYRDFTNWALCRTPHGIHRMGEDELLEEIEANVYVEAGLVVWDADSKTLKSVESTCINGHAIQLNVETWGTEKAPRQAFPRKKKGTRKKG